MDIVVNPKVMKEIRRIDRKAAKKIAGFLRRLSYLDDPRDKGHALHGHWGEFWTYRLGKYRVIVDIDDQFNLIRVLRIGHRKQVYKKQILETSASGNHAH